MGGIEQAAQARRREWRQGWPVVMAAGFGMGTGLGLYTLMAGLFIKPLQAEFGWTRAQIAAAGMLALVSAVLMPLVGLLADRRGARGVASAGLLLLAAAYASMALMDGRLVQMYGIALLVVVCGVATTPVLFTRPVNAWFDAARGSALGVALSGVSLFSVLAYPLLAAVIDHYGWRSAYLVLAAFPLVLGLPVVWRHLHERPPQPRTSTAAPGSASELDLPAILRDGRFWLLALALLCANLPIGGIMTQMQAMLSDKGFGAATAALLGSVYAAAIALGRISVGLLLDRLWAPAVAAVSLLLPIAGAGLLLGPPPPLLLAALAALLFGMAQGAEVDFVAFFAPRYFGLRASGTIVGLLMMVVTLSIASGSLLFGASFDRYASYDPALTASMGAFLVAAVAIAAAGLVDLRRNASTAAAAKHAGILLSDRGSGSG